MISPCHEGKAAPDALGRSAIFRSLQLAFAPLGGGSPLIENQTSICCLSPAGPPQKIELVISCQLRAMRKLSSEPNRNITSGLPTMRPVTPVRGRVLRQHSSERAGDNVSRLERKAVCPGSEPVRPSANPSADAD